ncbi:hypothetical protein D3C75_739230 [compost metagenome]
MGEDETTLGVVVLHREDAVHADARAWAQAGEESLAACVPEGIAQTLTAIFRPDDEKAHETEFAIVGGDGTAADQFAALVRRDEGGRVRGPEQLGIVKAGVPALTGSPLDEFVQFGTGHVAYDQLIRHREILLSR